MSLSICTKNSAILEPELPLNFLGKQGDEFYFDLANVN